MSDIDYATYFLSAKRRIQELELLEIGHPSFSKTYYIVRNKTDGVTVNLEDTTVKVFDWWPVKIDRKGSSDDLDSELQISIGDLGELVAVEMDRVRVAGTFLQKPYLKFRIYRSDDLTRPMYGPFTYECTSFAVTFEATTFAATARKLNVTGTGERYSLKQFPMLRAVT